MTDNFNDARNIERVINVEKVLEQKLFLLDVSHNMLRYLYTEHNKILYKLLTQELPDNSAKRIYNCLREIYGDSLFT